MHAETDPTVDPGPPTGGSGPAADSRALVTAARGTARAIGERTRAGGRRVGAAASGGTKFLLDKVGDLAPRVPVRDLATLREHYGGLEGEALADALVESAARHTSTYGAAGGVAAVRLSNRRHPAIVAVQLVAEPLAVAATEIKLMAELHEVYGVDVVGSGSERARYFAAAWGRARGVNPLDPQSPQAALGATAKNTMGRTLAARLGSRFVRTGPLLAGAAAGGMVNGRGTREIAERLRQELRNRAATQRDQIPADGSSDGPRVG